MFLNIGVAHVGNVRNLYLPRKFFAFLFARTAAPGRPVGTGEKFADAIIAAVDLAAHAVDMDAVAIVKVDAERIELVAGFSPCAAAETDGRFSEFCQ